MSQIVHRALLSFAFAGLVLEAAAEGPQFETRALWVDPASFSTPEAADRTIDRCIRAGLNTILPNVLCYGKTAFKSPHYRGQVLANDRFDPLAYLLQKAHAAEIQVQAWCCAYYEGGGPPTHPNWVNRSFDGRPFDRVFLSPAIPEVNAYLLPVFKDLLAYDIDGIHLDYIRFPGTAYDYSDAAREAFRKSAGFDPLNFLDHPEQIVPENQDPFPIRVLHPASHVQRVWETTSIERTLDQAEVGFAFISESPTNVTSLRAPGLLILSSYYEVAPEMLHELCQYVERGGDILWSDAPTGMLRTNPTLQELTGLTGGSWKAKSRLSLRPHGDHPLTHLVPTKTIKATKNCATGLTGAIRVASFDTGEPAVTVNRFGKGQAVVLGFDAMESTAGHAVSLVRGIVGWLRDEAGVSAPDALATKRAEWVKWRGDQVTDLVRAVSAAAKDKNPQLVITSSGGTTPSEFYACYRDSRRWLAEGINEHLFPMNYTPDPAELEDMLKTQARFAPEGKRDRIFPGLQIYATRVVGGEKIVGPAEAAVVEQELRMVQQQGYRGFCLFACNSLTDELIVVVRKFSPKTHPE